MRISSSHAGPHHGPAASILFGLVGDNRNGTTFTIEAHSPHSTYACMGCHMYDSNHSFEPSVDGCNQSGCHTGLTDFDKNGVQTAVQADLDMIGAALVDVHALSVDTLEDGSLEYHPHVGTVSGPEFSAFWNFMIALEDKSLGVHNPVLIQAMLDNAKENLGL